MVSTLDGGGRGSYAEAMSRVAINGAFGLPLYNSTKWFLERRGITDFGGLCTLSDRDRSLLPGWGKATEAKFIKIRSGAVENQ